MHINPSETAANHHQPIPVLLNWLAAQLESPPQRNGRSTRFPARLVEVDEDDFGGGADAHWGAPGSCAA
jgi:hypothetical protein